MGGVINFLNVMGWGGILALTVSKYVRNPYGYYSEDITL